MAIACLLAVFLFFCFSVYQIWTISVVSQAAVFSVLALAQTHFLVLCIDNLSINIHLSSAILPFIYYAALRSIFMCSLSVAKYK